MLMFVLSQWEKIYPTQVAVPFICPRFVVAARGTCPSNPFEDIRVVAARLPQRNALLGKGRPLLFLHYDC